MSPEDKLFSHKVQSTEFQKIHLVFTIKLNQIHVPMKTENKIIYRS